MRNGAREFDARSVRILRFRGARFRSAPASTSEMSARTERSSTMIFRSGAGAFARSLSSYTLFNNHSCRNPDGTSNHK